MTSYNKYSFKRLFFCFVGGIKSFASSNNAVTKWCLNRPEQAKNTAALKKHSCTEEYVRCEQEDHRDAKITKTLTNYCF